jgi:hypothetical protein
MACHLKGGFTTVNGLYIALLGGAIGLGLLWLINRKKK